MGCASSKSKAVGGSTNGLRKIRSNKSLDSIDVSDDDMTKASNDIKNRQEREQALFQEIQAEKEALRKVAFRLIEQRCSCENLLDLLDEKELDDLIVSKDSVKRQKLAHLKISKSGPVKIKDWILFNNKSNAINDIKMECITEFINYALLIAAGPSKNEMKVPTRSKSQYVPATSQPAAELDKKAVRQKSMYNRLPVGRNSLMNGQAVGVEEAQALEKALSSSSHSQYGFGDVSEKANAGNSDKKPVFASDELRQELLGSIVHTIAPQTSFYISDLNINDYDFAPGLITIATVASVIELYKMGGRLSPRSVRKLLRLGYRSLKSRPNTTQINLSGSDRLTVVGDIHGQLSDLLHIVDCSGLPSSSNRYLFNGDFVDRGPYGVEVMCVLMAMHAAMPEYVSLNRGNHEDYAICTAYGFQLECYEKYGEVIFGMFVEVFQQIPLFAIINNDVFVLHGGLFHNKQTTIADLNAIQRTKFSLEDMPEGGEGTTEVPRAKRKEFLKQLVRDALWSDPVDQPGMHHSVRGAGIGFGPDIAKNFLKHNNLKCIVRSHECVRSGYNEPYAGENKGLLCTIFSASDYGSSGNSAAYMVFRIHDENEEFAKTPRRSNYNMTLTDMNSDDGIDDEHEAQSDLKLVENSKLCYIVHYFYIDAEFREGENINNLHKDDTHPPAGLNGRHFAKPFYQAMYELDETKQFFIENEINQTLCIGQPTTLYNMILDKKFVLLDTLIEQDAKKEGMVTMTQLVHTFIDTLQVSLDLYAVLKVLLSEKCCRHHNGKNMVDYVAFLNEFEEKSSAPPPAPEEMQTVEEEDPNMDALTRYMKMMEKMKASNEKEKKKKAVEEEDKGFVKVARNNSASVIDVSHHLTNVQQLSGGGINAVRKDSDNVKSMTDKFKSGSLSIEIPDAPSRTRFSSDPFVADANTSSNNNATSSSQSAAGVTTNTTASGDEVKESDVHLEEISLENQSFHLYNIKPDLLDTLYVNYSSLEKAFMYFDRAKKGYITKEDLSIGIAEAAAVGLNRRFPNLSVDEILKSMDVNDSGKIDINIFFELFRVTDLHNNPPVDVADDVSLSMECSSSKSTGSMRLRSMSILQLQQVASSHNSPFPMSPMGREHRSDSHYSIEIKGVAINVDELTTAVSNLVPKQEGKDEAVDV